MASGEQIKKFAWSMLGATGIILFWRGLWEGSSFIPLLAEPWVSFVIGLVMLGFSAFIFRESPLSELEKITANVLRDISKQPEKQEFHIKYQDRLAKKDFLLEAKNLQRIEKGFLVVQDQGGQESFIPVARVNEVLRNGVTHWKPGAA
ncbi:hypothetical protein HYX14_00615 [Candidatus Woesearchaeota archaeon]|nr:hypothetical protein [Candidatus Woesearchaeota archaeon]